MLERLAETEAAPWRAAAGEYASNTEGMLSGPVSTAMRHGQICVVILAVGALFATMSGAQPAPSCEEWNSEEFFRVATVAGVIACLAAGADPRAQQAYSGRTPLHMAAVAGTTPEVIGILLSAGAGVNARATFGETPLQAALDTEGGGEPAVVEALLAFGADPNVRDSNDSTPLHRAAYNAVDARLVEVLIGAGADVRARDKMTPHSAGGRTPLHIAVASGGDRGTARGRCLRGGA